MIDFIVDLFSFEHPGLSYGVLDPVTAAILLKAGSQAVSSVSNIFSGRKDEKEAQERLKELGAEEEALKKKRTYGVADTFNKYLAASRQDKASDLLRQQEKERFATNVGALSGGGAKALLGGLSAQSRQSAMQQAQIEAGAQERQLDALKQYAAVEQAAANRNVGLAASDLARTQGLLDDQEAARIAARASKRQGITDTLQTGLNIAGDFADKEAESLTAKHGAKVYQNGGSGLGSLAAEKAQLKALAAELAQDKEEDTSEEKAPRLTASEAVERVRSKNLNEAAIEDIDQDDDAGEEKVPRLTASEKKALRRDRRFTDKEERYTERRERLKRDRELAPNVFERRQRLLDAIKGREQMALSQRQLDMLNRSNLTAQERQALIDRVIAGQGEEEEAEVPIVAPNRASNAGTSGAAQRIVEVGGRRVPGLKIPGLKHGGVKKTPGEFSHSKNPIDIMKDGAKIGEMTGGEYIFNPRQASTLQSLASKGGSPLHKYVRNLLKEFDKR